MARRMVETELWNDDDIISDFTAEDKFFWLYLLTNPHNTICGVLKYRPSLIARDMGLHKDTIINLVNRFQNSHKMIYFDKETDEILIFNWSKYNWTKSEDFLKTVKAKAKEVKSKTIFDYLQKMIAQKQSGTVYRPSQDRPNTNNNNDNNKYIEEFIIIWSKYPNKIGKERAQNAYILARKSGVSDVQIKQAVEQYAHFCKWKNVDKQYIKHGSTWFAQRCWEDDYSRADSGSFDVEKFFEKSLERTYGKNGR